MQNSLVNSPRKPANRKVSRAPTVKLSEIKQELQAAEIRHEQLNKVIETFMLSGNVHGCEAQAVGMLALSTLHRAELMIKSASDDMDICKDDRVLAIVASRHNLSSNILRRATNVSIAQEIGLAKQFMNEAEELFSKARSGSEKAAAK